MSCHQKAGQNHNLLIDNKFLICGKVQVFGNNKIKIAFTKKLSAD